MPIVIIETPPTAVKYIRVVEFMTDEELKDAKAERPDLVFTLAESLPDTEQVPEQVPAPLAEGQGITINSMYEPTDLEQRMRDVLKEGQ